MDVMDELSTICPECGYIGLEYDGELRALIHDWCGYYLEQDLQ